MANWETVFVKIIKEICKEDDIQLTSFDDWAFCLSKGGERRFIYGYQFGLDNAAVAAILKDKASASEMMEKAGIPHVPHWCVMSPAHPEFCTLNSGWEFLERVFKKYKDIVVKDNQGTGGRLVFRARTRKELERACHEIFSTAPSLAVSPYIPIEEEYRVIVLNGDVKIAFSKIRPHVVGDGIHTVSELLIKSLADVSNEQKRAMFCNKHLGDFRGEDILPAGKELVLEWRHNLGQGAAVRLISEPEVLDKLKSLAEEVVDFFDLRFASIDVVKTKGEYKILEINSGVMMENFASTDEKCYQLAKQIYTKAIYSMFGIDKA